MNLKTKPYKKCNKPKFPLSLSLFILFSMICGSSLTAKIIDIPEAITLFGFKSNVNASWSNQDINGYNDSTVTIETSQKYVTNGSKSLKLTFHKGKLPCVYTESITMSDWADYKTLSADVYLERDSLVVFRFIQEKSQ